MKYSPTYFTITLILLCCSILSIGQDTVANFSEPIEKEADFKPIEFFDLGSHYGLLLGNKKSATPFTFFHFDSTLSVVKQIHLEATKGAKFLNSYVVNGQPCLFYSRANQTNEQELLVFKIDPLGEIMPPFVLTKFKNNGGYKTGFKLAISDNSKKLVVLVEHAFEKSKNEKITLILFNENLKLTKIANKTLDVLVKHKRKNFPIISNNGSVYIVKKFFHKKSQYYVMFLNGASLEEAKISLRTREVVSLRYSIAEDDQLHVFGFFSSPIFNNYEGVFSLKFNKSVHPVFKKEAFLTERVVHSFKSKKEIKTHGFGLDNFHLKSIFKDSLANHFLVAEHLYVSHDKMGSTGFRKGLLVVKFDKLGNFIWSSPLLIGQNELFKKIGSNWTSSIVYMVNSQVNIVYNQLNYKSKKNAELEGNNLHKIVHLALDNLGNPVKKAVSKLGEFDGDRMGVVPKYLNANEESVFLMLQNETKKSFRIVKFGD